MESYLLAMFFIVQTCALVQGLAGLDIIHVKHLHKPGIQGRDALLLFLSVCYTVQALHYLFQALRWPLSDDWFFIVRTASTVIPFVFTLHVLNGRVNQFFNWLYDSLLRGCGVCLSPFKKLLH